MRDRLNIEGFHASNGWLDSFRRRHEITWTKTCGEGRDVDLEIVRSWKEKELGEQLKGYPLKDVFNGDETGYFYKQWPDRSLHFKNDDAKGGKLAMDRVRYASQ